MAPFRTLLLAAAATMIIAPAAQAQQQSYRSLQECEAARQNRQVAGALLGAVVGGVLGAQIHNSSESARRDRYQPPRYGRGYGHRGRHYAPPPRRSNDGAVIAGAGLGGIAGAVIGGGSDPCAHLRTGYGQGYYDPSKPPGYGGYDDAYYGQNDGYYGQHDAYYDDRQDDYYAYDQGSQATYGYSGSELAGGPPQPYTQDTRAYQASSTGNCRYMGQQQTYMCAGPDGIFRPAR